MEIFIAIIIIALIVIFAVLYNYFNNTGRGFFSSNATPEEKGERGERKVACMLGQTIVGKQYVINNLMLNKEQGGTSQIDHVIINRNGVFIIETKSWAGCIYGKQSQDYWVQVLAYGNVKNQVYSPIKQNNSHLYYVINALGHNVPVFSLIVFTQAEKIETDAQNVIYYTRLRGEISKERGVCCSIQQMEEWYNKLKSLNANDYVSNTEHFESIKQMQSKIDIGICPRCGGFLVVRNGKNGEFYGCKNYPRCRFTKNIDKR